ncbi:MAG: carboxypeptidase-like regulatory domain-containing protein [Candidatus Didemnitutus sp.]|nr:carboxypeptidase-like regulatory domain-containing protein [Candidatus Didemnitutus sp.]
MNASRLLVYCVMGFITSVASMQAVPQVVIVPATLAVNSTNSAMIQITGLNAPGNTVLVERFLDVNGNGVIDGADALVQSSLVTDGPAPQIGGQRNRHIPADEDATANAEINTPISLSATAELGRLVGSYLVRVSSPTAQFAAVTAPFALTATSDGQSISGTITSNGTTPVPHAMVGLLVLMGDDDEFLWGTVADANGQYTISAPAGEYLVIPVASGYVVNFENLPQITLTNNQVATANITMTPTTRTISGKVANSANPAVGLPGVQLFVQSMDGLFTIAFTDAAGNFSFGATAAAHEIETSEKSLALLGYVSTNASTLADATAGNVTNLAINFSPVTALIYGVVANSAQVPLANVGVWANDGQNTYNLYTNTDANGAYMLGALAGNWQVGVDQDAPALAGLVPPPHTSVSLSTGQAGEANFVALAASAHFQGTVTNNGVPVANVRVGASLQSSNTNLFLQATTDANGNYNLGVLAGTWHLALENNSAASNNLVSSSRTEVIANNQTRTGINLPVVTGTGTIRGQVTGANATPITSGNVYAYTNLNGVGYNVGAQLDDFGNYSFPVINGSWTVGVNANNLTYQNQTINVTGASHVVNFAPVVVTAHLQGTLTNNGAPVAGMLVAASQIGGNLYFQTTTDGSGQFDIGVVAGTWRLFLPIAQNFNLATEVLASLTVATNQTIADIPFRVRTTTGTISGTITDFSGAVASGVFVSGNITVGNVNYAAGLQTDANGHYSLNVFDGTWNVQPSGNGLNFARRDVVVSGSATANFAATVFNQHPTAQTVSANQSASFNVQTAPPSAATLQWQVSTNGGASWSNLANNSPYSGVAGGTLAIFPTTTNLNGNHYRCVVTYNSGTASETSQAAALTVNPLTQTITFPTLANVAYSTTPVSLQASASSGLTVSYSIVSGPATLTGGNTLTLTGTGSVTVRASQPGDLIYAAATHVDRTFTASANFQSWLLERFDASQRADAQQTGPHADFDRDGLSNLVEYALGRDPRLADATPALDVTATGNDWTATYQRPSDRSELTYAVEISTDLSTWVTTGVTHERTASGATETWQARYPLASGTRVFIRLSVTQP